jgi:hypothetical protein
MYEVMTVPYAFSCSNGKDKLKVAGNEIPGKYMAFYRSKYKN